MPTTEHFTTAPYLRTCPARVLRHDADGLVLDATVFYPLGGGQPGDTGHARLADGSALAIIDTRRNRDTGEILHLTAPDAPRLAAGSEVMLELDWERRHRHMRMHTALHLLSAVIKAGVTGGNLSDSSGRLDFDAAGMALDPEHIGTELNRLVAADLPVHTRRISGADLRAQPELIKTMSVSPPLQAEVIRLIEVEGADLQPCGGTHVARTGEIGPLRVARIENKGSRNRRVVLAFEEA